MRIATIALFSILIAVSCLSCTDSQQIKSADLSESLKGSLVCLKVSVGGYEQIQPWKQAPVREAGGYGCAVGPYEVLTTAENVVNATMIQVRRHGKNEFIPAMIKVVDYEANLCLLELDKALAGGPMEPIRFAGRYVKSAETSSYWLSSGGHLTSGRGYMDRASCTNNPVSWTRNLTFIASNTSRATGNAELYCLGKEPVGIACWAGDNEAGIIPPECINAFLDQVRSGEYKGFGLAGFELTPLLDPAVRKFLKMPDDMNYGALVSKVYALGSGSDMLKTGDVVLAIDGKNLNPYGRYMHPEYDRLSFEHLIASGIEGDSLRFEVFREGQKQELEVKVRRFSAGDMLVPYYEYGTQPEYIVTGGLVFQKLTRDYFGLWGENWPGKVPPHLYNYYAQESFNPGDKRRDVVILSYVLPARINQGYQQLGRMVVKSFNGKEIKALEDILQAQKTPHQSGFNVVEFELDSPKIVLDRSQLASADAQIAQSYGITKMSNTGSELGEQQLDQ